MGPGARPGLLMGFGSSDEQVLRNAVRTLAGVIRDLS
jgi:hypothetical protein